MRLGPTTSEPAPFNGLPIIYGIVGYMALVVVALVAVALAIGGSGVARLAFIVEDRQALSAWSVQGYPAHARLSGMLVL